MRAEGAPGASDAERKGSGATRGRKLSLALAGALAAVLMLEGGLALTGHFPRPAAPVRVERVAPDQVRLHLRGEEGEVEVVTARAAAPPDTRRIVVVGDSTIFGTHVRAHSTIPKQLEVLLPPATGVAWEALNLGREGIAAREVCALGEAALDALGPDLLVVYTGHNEFLPPQVEPYFEARRRPLRAALARVFGWSRIGRALFGGRRVEEAGVDALGEGGRLRGALAGGILEHSEVAAIRPRMQRDFQARLERLARAAAAHGVPVILVGPTSNGREYGPVGSAFSRAHSEADRERFVELLNEALSARHAGDLDACETALAAAVAIDPEVAELAHQRGALAWARGEEASARLLDLECWGLDESARAASGALIERMEAAASATGASFVALGAVLERAPRAGEPRLFLDNVHPGVYGQYLMARALAPECARAQGLASDGRWLEYDEACAALAIPRAFLERSETFTVMGDVNYATWAFDPLPYMARARAVLDGLEPAERATRKFLVADLYLAILDQDAERVLARTEALAALKDADLTGLFAPVRKLPRMRGALASAGLELSASDPPQVRRVE